MASIFHCLLRPSYTLSKLSSLLLLHLMRPFSTFSHSPQLFESFRPQFCDRLSTFFCTKLGLTLSYVRNDPDSSFSCLIQLQEIFDLFCLVSVTLQKYKNFYTCAAIIAIWWKGASLGPYWLFRQYIQAANLEFAESCTYIFTFWETICYLWKLSCSWCWMGWNYCLVSGQLS